MALRGLDIEVLFLIAVETDQLSNNVISGEPFLWAIYYFRIVLNGPDSFLFIFGLVVLRYWV